MSRRQLIPISFGGVGLTTTGRRAFFDYDGGSFDTPLQGAIQLARLGGFPSHVDVQPSGKVLPLHFVIKSSDSERQFNAIAKIFNPDDGEQPLIVEDECGVRKQLQCISSQVIHDQNHDRPLIVPLFAADPIWVDPVVTSVTDDIDLDPTNPITLSMRNEGTYRALPTFVGQANIQKLQAEGFIHMQEVLYANRSEFSLTGPGSGTWLIDVTGTAAFDSAAEIAAGRMETDGDDIVVLIDEVPVQADKVTIADINTTDTKIWVEIADGPKISAARRNSLLAGTTTFIFEPNHPFRVGDYIVWANDAAVFEEAKVTAVDGVNVTVTRGTRGSGTPGVNIAETETFRAGHHVQLAWGFSGAVTRLANPDPPLIDTSLSTNLSWFWPIGPIWPDDNRRPGGWRRILYDGRSDVPDLRRNRLSSRTALDVSGGDIRFTDLDPTADRPNFDALEFNACCGIDDTLGAIEYDASLDWAFAFQIIGRDLLGLDQLIFNRIGDEGAAIRFPPIVYTNQQETPPGILSAVILRARQWIIATSRPDDTTEEVLAEILTSGSDMQGFRIDEEAQILAIEARGRHQTAGTLTMFVQINEVGVGAITSGAQPGAGSPGLRLIGPYGGAGTLGAVFIQITFYASTAAAFTTDIPVLSPGDYFLSIATQTGSGQINIPRSDGSIYAKGSHWEHDGDAFVRFPDEDLWFAIMGTNVDNQEETLHIQRTNEDLLINDITLVFDPDRTPVVVPAARQDAYYYDDTFSRGDDSFTFKFLKPSADALGATVTIDIEARTVVDDDTGEDIRQTLVAVDEPWLTLPPGDNTVTITAANGAQGENWIGQHQHSWQA